MAPRNLIVAAVLGIVMAIGIGVSLRVTDPIPDPMSDTQTATVLPSPIQIPEFSLVDQLGGTIGPEILTGQWDLVFFGFTRCPDVCPLTMQILSQARRTLEDQGQDPLPRIVLVSVDPERDPPEELKRYVGYFGEGNLGITGELTELRKLTDSLGIYFEKVPVDGENYAVDHSAVVLVVDPQGRFSALFSAPHNIDTFVHDLPILMSKQ